MDEEQSETELSPGFSTYGLLTAKRVLARLNINLDNEELITAIKNPKSVYSLLLQVPLKNVFNGIILQQAYDYQVYAQKVFIDYLLSGESGKDDASAGANTREDLEIERIELIEVGKAFNQQEFAHQQLIASSQASLIKVSHALQKSLQTAVTKIGQLLQSKKIIKDEMLIAKSIRSILIAYDRIDNEILAVSSSCWGRVAEILEIDLNNELRQQFSTVLNAFDDPRDDINENLSSYLEQAADIGINLRSSRTQLYGLILKATDFIKLLPDYRVNLQKEEENRSSLYFDPNIGD